MAALQIKVNGQSHAVDVLPDTPLLWVLRDNLRLTGTKFGCGLAQCGACTVFFDGQPLRWKKWAEGRLIYSIGVNLIDDGGDNTLLNGHPKDIVFRLFDPDNRRQPPRPTPVVSPAPSPTRVRTTTPRSR